MGSSSVLFMLLLQIGKPKLRAVKVEVAEFKSM